MYQPWHNLHSLPPYCPYLATSNISPYNKVNINYHGQCSEKELFTTSSMQIRQMDKVFYMTTSSSEWREVLPRRIMITSPWGFAQLAIKKKPVVEKQWETHIVCTEVKEKWIKDYVQRECTVARTQVEDAERAIRQAQEDTRKTENEGLMTRQPKRKFL